jgi:RHS repeat-associated protein
VADGLVLEQSPAAGSSAGAGTAIDLTVSLGPDAGLPPNPQTVAPPADPTVATIVADATKFLYGGSNPVQTGVAEGAIEARRAAVIRGRVLDKANRPLPGVLVTIKGHPEFGQTLSRADGGFDLAVNGGGSLTVEYRKEGYLPAQRQDNVPWQDYAVLDEVVLIPLDSRATPVELGAAAPAQAARGNPVTDGDGDGARQATLLFPAGIQATLTLPDGTAQPLRTLHVRATEYTVGENGPKAMPGPLPPASAYTYAVELSADEALATGAKTVGFDRPVPFYVENFPNFPVGGIVPAGWYDRDKTAWIPSDNGRIIEISGIANGLADLDTDGDGLADAAATLAALGITPEEQAQLAQLYPAGQTLWRVPIRHFTPWDLNWPYGPPPDAEPPNPPEPETDDKNKEDDPCERQGSIIECENQVLGERLPIAGTPYTLNYRSDRVPGRKAAYTVKVYLSGAHVSASLKRIALEIAVAGRVFNFAYPGSSNQTHVFTWDGLDAYGRPVQGMQSATVRIGYVYDGAYQQTTRFGYNGNGIPITGDWARQEVTLWRNTPVQIGAPPFEAQVRLGAWTLNMHHTYDPIGKILYQGYGGRRSTQSIPPVIETVAGKGYDGLDYGYGDAGPATSAILRNPSGVAVSADGSLYIASTTQVRRVGPDGIITTVAGNGQYGYSGDGGPAIAAKVSPQSIAVGTDGSLYIADYQNHCIRRVGPDGLITTVAGTGQQGYNGDGGPATAARLSHPESVAVGINGDIYITNTIIPRISRVHSTLPGITYSDYLIPSEDGTELYRFNEAGRHLQTLDALTGAVRHQFAYDAAGRLSSATDGDGNTTAIERDAQGNPAAVVAPNGQRTTLGLDANGYLASVTNPADETYRMAYTADGLLTAFETPNGHASAFRYDGLGRLIEDRDAAGNAQTLVRTWLAQGYEVAHATAEGRGFIHRVERLATGDKRRTFVDPAGLGTTALLQTNGTTTLTEPDGTITTRVEGPDPRFGMQAPIPESLTLRTGGLTASLATTRTATLADAHNPLSLTTLTDTVTLNGRTSQTVYDAASRTFTATSPAGRTAATVIDGQGRPVAAQVSGLAPLQAIYDARGRRQDLTWGQGAGSRTVHYGYYTHGPSQGWLHTVTDALNRTVSYDYDAAGRITQTTLPDGRSIQFGYDPDGNLTSLIPPGQPAHLFDYTALDQADAYTPPAAGAADPATRYTYNRDWQLARITRPDGQAVDFAYDAAGRLSTLTAPGGATAYGYNGTIGKLATVTAPDGGTLGYTYAGALLTQAQWTGAVTGRVGYAYDTDFRVKAIQLNGADPVAYGYDADSLLTSAGALTLSRDAQNGLLTGTSLAAGPNAITDSFTYNGFGEVMAYRIQFNITELFSVQYTRDALGRLTRKAEAVNGVVDTFDYGYDPAGWLVEVKQNGIVTAAYGYDDNGNRTTLNGQTVAQYDAQDRLLTSAGMSYTYTPNGELQTKTAGGQVTGYAYDVLGNLRHVDLPGGTPIDYVIDGRNRRIGKKVNGTQVQGFLYQDGLRIIAELDGGNQMVSRFVYADKGNVPAYLVKGGTTYRIVSDHLGSPRLVVNTADGTVAQRLDYDAWGWVLLDTNPGFQPFGYAGGLYDRDTGLVRFGARDYDPETGRWTAKDPIGFGGGDANLYGYVRNNPIRYTDPRGLNPAAGAIAGGVIGGPAGAIVGGIIGGLVGATAADYIYDHWWDDEDEDEPIPLPKSKPKNQKESRPKNCPTGTVDIDTVDIDKAKGKFDWDKDTLHGIKDAAHGGKAGPRDWTGVTPDGLIGTNDGTGNWEDQGNWEDLL